MPAFFKVECPTGGYWLVKRATGGVYAYNDAGETSGDGVAPFFGSMAGTPMNAPVVDLVPFLDQQDHVVGYLLTGGDGGTFAFGQAHAPDNYVNHPDWHGGARTVIGAIQNGAGYTLITVEDGSDPPKLDLYDFSKAYPKG